MFKVKRMENSTTKKGLKFKTLTKKKRQEHPAPSAATRPKAVVIIWSYIMRLLKHLLDGKSKFTASTAVNRSRAFITLQRKGGVPNTVASGWV